MPTQTQGAQAWDRYAFVNNNPVRYMDPTGNFVAAAATLTLGIGFGDAIAAAAASVVAFVSSPAVITALVVVAVVAVVAVGAYLAYDYISTNTENRTQQLEESFGRTGDSGGWNLCPNAAACVIGTGVLAGLFLKAVTSGGCGEDESNCVMPTSTPTDSKNRQPYNLPSSTPTQSTTSTPTSTPTPTSMPTPFTTPTPVYHRYGEQLQ